MKIEDQNGLVLKEFRGCRDVSAVQIASHSAETHMQSSQLHGTPAPGHLLPPAGLQGLLHAHDAHELTQTHTST